MAFRLYLVPAIGAGTMLDPRRAKYFQELGAAYTSMDFGFQPVFIACADLSTANDAAVTANADVFAFPFDLAPQISGDQNTLGTALEAKNIPAHWLTGAFTWLEAVRTVLGMFQFAQRLNGVIGNIVLIDETNRTLNTQWNAIPADIRSGILTAASSLRYDTSFIANNTQVRAILKNFADQWSSRPFIFGGITI